MRAGPCARCCCPNACPRRPRVRLGVRVTRHARSPSALARGARTGARAAGVHHRPRPPSALGPRRGADGGERPPRARAFEHRAQGPMGCVRDWALARRGERAAAAGRRLGSSSARTGGLSPCVASFGSCLDGRTGGARRESSGRRAAGATGGEAGGGMARRGTTGGQGRSAAEEGAWPRRGARPGRRGAAWVFVGAGARRARWAARA